MLLLKLARTATRSGCENHRNFRSWSAGKIPQVCQLFFFPCVCFRLLRLEIRFKSSFLFFFPGSKKILWGWVFQRSPQSVPTEPLFTISRLPPRIDRLQKTSSICSTPVVITCKTQFYLSQKICIAPIFETLWEGQIKIRHQSSTLYRRAVLFRAYQHYVRRIF